MCVIIYVRAYNLYNYIYVIITKLLIVLHRMSVFLLIVDCSKTFIINNYIYFL
jgi:hypothetical protein